MTEKLCALCLAGTIATLGASASTSLESYLPEQCSIVTSISDYKDVEKQWTDCPLAEICKNEDLKACLKPWMEKIKKEFDDKLGQDSETDYWDLLQDQLDGQVVIALDLANNDQENEEENTNNVLPNITMLANVRDADELTQKITAEINEQIDKDDESITQPPVEQYADTDIHFLTISPKPDEDENDDEDSTEDKDTVKIQYKFCYGHVKDTFFLTTRFSSAKDVVDAIKGHGEHTFADSDNFQKIKAEWGDSEGIYYFVDLKSSFTQVEQSLLTSAKRGQRDNTKEQQDAKVQQIQAIIDALALHTAFDYAFVDMKADSDSVCSNTHIVVDTNTGIGRLFKALSDGSYPTPGFVPDSVMTVSSSNVNIGTALKELKNLIFSMNPSYGMIYQMYLNQTAQKTGVNLETDFIDNFDSGLVSFSLELPNQQDSLIPQTGNIYAIKIKQPDAFTRALNALLAVIPGGDKSERRDYNGTSMILLPGADGGAPSAVIAVKDNWILISNRTDTMQNALSTSENAKSFWKSDNYTDFANGRTTSDGISMQYGDISPMVRLSLKTMAAIVNNTATSQDLTPLIDTSLIQNIQKQDIPFISPGKTIRTDDGISSEIWLLKKE